MRLNRTELPRTKSLLWTLATAFVIAGGCSSDTTPCEDGDAECAPSLESLRLTYLDVQYDLAQPVYVNNRVPLTFGVTAGGPEGASQQVAVSFSFVEANPADPSAPIECSSSALVVEVPGDGAEHQFNGYIWPTSACDELIGNEVNVRVTFEGGEEVESAIDAPSVSYTAAAAGEALNQLCKTASGEAGCVYNVNLQPTPSDAAGSLIDVRHAAMTSDSSVAVLPDSEELAGSQPTLSVESVLVVNGRDPYIAALAPEEVPADLEADEPGITDELRFGLDPSQIGQDIAMPGPARLRYDLRPVGSTDDHLPLTVKTSDEADAPRVDAVPITELLPGTANQLSHELYAEGATYSALAPLGAWADVSDFELRGCFEADFDQAGNEGEIDYADDCQTLEVVMVREEGGASAATSFELNHRLGKRVGGSRLRLEVGLETRNRLDNTGASSLVEGNATIRGRLGRSFGIDIARAKAEANVGIDPATNGYEVTVDAFNQRVFERSQSGGEIVREEEFSVGKSHRFPNLGFGFGPVRIGITVRLGGEVGIRSEDSLTATTDAATCMSQLNTQEPLIGCGSLSRTVTPFFAFTANIFGGVRIGRISGGVDADLRIIDTGFPLSASLNFGLFENGGIGVAGNANFGVELTLIKGNVSIVGRIRFRARFLRRFNRTLRVNLFRFSSPVIRRTLLDRTIAFEVLQ
ncbi:MAG: hypothetical protein AAGF12_15110 [Myxococcota bacterium]